MWGNPGRWLAVALLVALHLLAVAADLVAPYDPARQHREQVYSPPTRLHFVDPQGRLHWRPFVYRLVEEPGGLGVYREDRSRTYPVRFWVEGPPRRIVGPLVSRTRLLGVDEPARLFLLGTDDYGRDLFSRLLYGGRVSLFAGLLAGGLALALGFVFGTAAGYRGGWLDEALMRGTELFQALPWLYLLFGVRALLPLEIEPARAFLLFVLVIAGLGWARPARLFRGVTLAVRGCDYVLAARGVGASHLEIVRRHVLPQTLELLWTQLALLVPRYVLAEASLSFLGLGIGEPVPSWGNMLASLQRYHVLVSYGWMFAPAVALLAVALCYQRLADRPAPRHAASHRRAATQT